MYVFPTGHTHAPLLLVVFHSTMYLLEVMAFAVFALQMCAQHNNSCVLRSDICPSLTPQQQIICVHTACDTHLYLTQQGAEER